MPCARATRVAKASLPGPAWKSAKKQAVESSQRGAYASAMSYPLAVTLADPYSREETSLRMLDGSSTATFPLFALAISGASTAETLTCPPAARLGTATARPAISAPAKARRTRRARRRRRDRAASSSFAGDRQQVPDLVGGDREVTGGERPLAHVAQPWLLGRADRPRLGAARVEATTRRRVGGARPVAAEQVALAMGELGVGDRDGGQQRAGVAVARQAVERVARRQLDDLAEVHHRDPVAHVAHDCEVVGDEDHRQAELALQLAQQVEDLRLDRDVERGDRLVGDDQLRLQRPRAREPHPPTPTARELVRVAVVVLGVQADPVHQLLHALLALARAGLQPVDHERIGDDPADRLARVQRRVGVLEDHLHLAADRLQPRAPQLRDVATLEAHLARRRVEQPSDQAGRRALAAARLADQPERP